MTALRCIFTIEMKIYTKKGDSGQTSLFGGTRLQKDDIRIEAYGTVDETNAALGLLSGMVSTDIADFLQNIQRHLFDIGAHLASDGSLSSNLPELKDEELKLLEDAIDAYDADLEPLRAFILPGGSRSSSFAHLARTVCRRAERRVVSLSQVQDVDVHIIKYLNRLSDYLFILSRKLNADQAVDDVEWKPKR